MIKVNRKRKGGRPSKPTDEKRTHVVTIKLTDTEWLYRGESTHYRTDEEKVKLSNTEREFLTGTSHEQDSIKNLIRHWEHKYGTDKTYLYFNPAEN